MQAGHQAAAAAAIGFAVVAAAAAIGLAIVPPVVSAAAIGFAVAAAAIGFAVAASGIGVRPRLRPRVPLLDSARPRVLLPLRGRMCLAVQLRGPAAYSRGPLLALVLRLGRRTTLVHEQDAHGDELLPCAKRRSGAPRVRGGGAGRAGVAPRNAGVLLGISNTMATLPGILCNLTAGALLASGAGWAPIFLIAAVMEVVGGSAFLWLAEGEAQF